MERTWTGMNNNTVWVLCQDIPDEDRWELGGVFSTRDQARAACVDDTDQIWEETLDVVLPRETCYPDYVEWPLLGYCKMDGVYYTLDGEYTSDEAAESWEPVAIPEVRNDD